MCILNYFSKLKSIIVICFVMFSVFTVDGQVTEHFSDETPGATSFSNSGVTYNLTGGKFEIAYGSAYGYTGTTTDDYYVDNWSSILNAAGVVGAITKTTNNFYVYDFWIFPGDGLVTKSNGGTIIIRGKLSGATQFTKTVEGADINLGVGYTYVDLTSFSTTEIDELEFELTGNLRYLAVDAFRHQSVAANATPTATAPSAPSVTEDDTNVALADDIQVADTDGDDQTVTFTITGGTLTIGTAGSITFPSGSNGTSSFSAAGNLSDINAALDAATFTPTPNLNGTNAGTISFTTNDGTVSSSAASVSFNITAVNDKPTASSFTTSTIYENTTYAFATANFGYSDDDGDPLDHVRITAVPSNGTLWLDSDGSGTVNGGESALSNNVTVSKADLDAGKLKYLNTNGTSSSFTFDVSDGTDYSTSTYTATLTVTPEPTVTLSLDPSSSISENAGSTSVKATLSNTFNKTVSVNLLKSGTTSGTDYSLSSTTISITTGNTTGTATITGVNDDLDENNETVIIDISSVTNGTESGTQQVTCTLIDDDNTPVVTASQSFSIAENIANSGVVGTVLATDVDAGTSFSAWTEIGGTGASIFEINASSGAITVTDNSGIDYETTTSYTYTVTVSDGTNTSASEMITITH